MKKLILSVFAILILISSSVLAKDNSWYYTRNEVDSLYKMHYNREDRIANYIDEAWAGRYIARGDNGDYIEVPTEFIKYIMLHLWNAIENGWVNYLFWADLNHGHLFVPTDLWKSKYSHGNDSNEIFRKHVQQILREDGDKLGILYHAAEHFDSNDPANEKAIQTRNIIGWFDGRSIELAYPDPEKDKSAHIKANTAGDPDGYDRKWFISISASKNGRFAIYPNGKEIRFDISFYENDVYDSTTYPRKKPKPSWRDYP